MLKLALFGSVAVLLCSAIQAHAVPLSGDLIDRAVACSVYAGFASDTDPRTSAAKRAIDETVREAVSTGRRTQNQVNNAFYDTAHLAMYREPRAELIADWNECRDSFAPPTFDRS